MYVHIQQGKSCAETCQYSFLSCATRDCVMLQKTQALTCTMSNEDFNKRSFCNQVCTFFQFCSISLKSSSLGQQIKQPVVEHYKQCSV
jgi:hypothetical protein